MPLCLSGNRSVSVGEGRILLHPIRLPKDRVSRGSELAGRDGQQDHTQKNWRNKADVGGSWKWKAKGSVAQSCPTLCNPMDQGLLPIQFSRQENWVGIHSFSRGSSHPGIEPAISCIAGRFLTDWATRQVPAVYKVFTKTGRGPWLGGDSALGPPV